MRLAASAAVLTVAVTFAGAARGQPHLGTPEGMPHTVAGGPAGASDFVDRTMTAPLVARGHVLAAPTGGKLTFKVHVDRWLKASGPTDLVVNFGGQRPVTPKGSAEILFLSPPLHADAGKEGADLRSVAKSDERYTVPDAQTELIDQVVQDLLAHAPQAQVLLEMVQLPEVLSEPAASRLALRATRNAAALQAADTAVQSPKTNEAARGMLVSMLGGRLPLATLSPLVAGGHADPLRMAALSALGRMAANDPKQRAQATAVIQAATHDPNPHVSFAAGMALANFGQASALAPLNAVLEGTDAPLRAEAVRGLAALARFGNTDAADRLKSLRGDPDKEVARRATTFVGQLDPQAVKAAQGAKAAGGPSVKVFAAVSAGVVVLLLIGVFALRRRKA